VINDLTMAPAMFAHAPPVPTYPHPNIFFRACGRMEAIRCTYKRLLGQHFAVSRLNPRFKGGRFGGRTEEIAFVPAHRC
jgi:hypothetical protein